MSFTPLDLSLYVHYPFCVRKCPYCDFFSKAQGACRERDLRYLKALCDDFDDQLIYINGRRIKSVYFGGGTPSLCDPDLIGAFLEHIKAYLTPSCEISMEANPGTTERSRFEGYLDAGINRLSIGVQSFDDGTLKKIGRIHTGAQAMSAVEEALGSGFRNVNLDIMHGLPVRAPPWP